MQLVIFDVFMFVVNCFMNFSLRSHVMAFWLLCQHIKNREMHNNYNYNYCCMIMPSGCRIFNYVDRELSSNTDNYQETHTIIQKHTQL